MYATGKGVPQDLIEAAGWFRKAAEQGFRQAQASLGIMTYQGQGVTQDFDEAAKWFRMAAEQGDVRAQNNLGAMYGNGEGVSQDYVLAYVWLSFAAQQGHSEAVQHRDHLAKRMTSAQVVEAERIAREWRAKSTGE